MQRDEDALKQLVGVVGDQRAVLVGPGLALSPVADQIDRAVGVHTGLDDRSPLDTRGEPGTAASTQAGPGDLLHHVSGISVQGGPQPIPAT